MSYPINAVSPPKLFAGVVAAATGDPIIVGVVAKYSVGAGAQAAGLGTCQHEGGGQWSYTPTTAETNVSAFGIQFYHTDAVGDGPTVSVVTGIAQTGDSFVRIGVAGAGLTAIPTVASVGTVTGNVVGSVGSVVGAITVTTNNDKTGYALSGAGVDGILDEVVETGYTMRELLRLMSAVLCGKVSGGGTVTVTFRDVTDSANRVVATLDAMGNRAAVVLNDV